MVLVMSDTQLEIINRQNTKRKTVLADANTHINGSKQHIWGELEQGHWINIAEEVKDSLEVADGTIELLLAEITRLKAREAALVEGLRAQNPYPESVFTPMTKDQEYFAANLLIVPGAGIFPDKVFGCWGRRVWNNCCDEMERELDIITTQNGDTDDCTKPLLTPNPADTTAEETCGNCGHGEQSAFGEDDITCTVFLRCGENVIEMNKNGVCVYNPSKWTPKEQEEKGDG